MGNRVTQGLRVGIVYDARRFGTERMGIRSSRRGRYKMGLKL